MGQLSANARRVLEYLYDARDPRERIKFYIEMTLSLGTADLEVASNELFQQDLIAPDDKESLKLTPDGFDWVEQARQHPSITVHGDVGPGAVVGPGSVCAKKIAGRDIVESDYPEREEHLLDHVVPRPAVEDLAPSVRILQGLSFVQAFNLGLSPQRFCCVEQRNCLWISDGEQVEVFEPERSEPVDRWLLPDIRWKHFLLQLWRGYMLCSDWDGTLYMFNRRTRGQQKVLYQARYNDLPIHRLVLGQQGQLVAGTWDGRILAWNAEGQPILESNTQTIPYLPIHLLPCSGSRIAVADQAGHLWLLDAEGERIWAWKADGAIKALWVYETDGGQLIFLLLTNNHIVRIKAEEETAKSILLNSEVVSLAHLDYRPGDCCTAIALRDQGVEWLSWSPFRLAPQGKVKLDFQAHQILPVRDPQQPGNRIALGLSDEGQLFLLNDREYHLYHTPNIRHLMLDHSGRFMFWRLEDRIEVYRNPAILPVACEVELNKVDGELIVGEYHEINVVLENTGAVPISRVKARLTGKDRISPANEIDQRGHFLPGELITLTFSVKAAAAGARVPLELALALEDTAGPPAVPVHLDIGVKSSLL